MTDDGEAKGRDGMQGLVTFDGLLLEYDGKPSPSFLEYIYITLYAAHQIHTVLIYIYRI